jgi:hypothetical protein
VQQLARYKEASIIFEKCMYKLHADKQSSVTRFMDQHPGDSRVAGFLCFEYQNTRM